MRDFGAEVFLTQQHYHAHHRRVENLLCVCLFEGLDVSGSPCTPTPGTTARIKCSMHKLIFADRAPSLRKPVSAVPRYGGRSDQSGRTKEWIKVKHFEWVR